MSTQPPPSDNALNEAPGISWTTLYTKTGGKINLTIRALSGREALDELVETVIYAKEKYHFDVIPTYPEKAETQTAPALALPSAPLAPPVINPPANGGTREAQCVLIEVGTSYTGNKTQLKFTCNGMDFPLLFTKSVADMVTLLAPIGFTPAHIVVGQKYPINCRVFYAENVRDGKARKDVQRVAAG